MTRFGRVEIFNSHQGAHHTIAEFLRTPNAPQVRFSTHGIGRWRDKVFIERRWHSMKCEEMYLHANSSVTEALSGLAHYIDLFVT